MPSRRSTTSALRSTRKSRYLAAHLRVTWRFNAVQAWRPNYLAVWIAGDKAAVAKALPQFKNFLIQNDKTPIVIDGGHNAYGTAGAHTKIVCCLPARLFPPTASRRWTCPSTASASSSAKAARQSSACPRSPMPRSNSTRVCADSRSACARRAYFPRSRSIPSGSRHCED